MPNKPYPWVINIPYRVTGVSHDFNLNVLVTGSADPGADPLEVNVWTKGDVAITLAEAMAQIQPIFVATMPNEAEFGPWTLFNRNELNSELQFISGGAFTVTTGTAGVAQLGRMSTLTFRTPGGDGMKIVVLDPAEQGNGKSPLLTTGTAWYNKWAAYVMSDDNVCIARDGTMPVQPLSVSHGPNRRTFRNRFRA